MKFNYFLVIWFFMNEFFFFFNLFLEIINGLLILDSFLLNIFGGIGVFKWRLINDLILFFILIINLCFFMSEFLVVLIEMVLFVILNNDVFRIKIKR